MFAISGAKAGSGSGRPSGAARLSASQRAGAAGALGRPRGVRTPATTTQSGGQLARLAQTNPRLATSIKARQQMQSRLAGNLSALTRSGRGQATRFINGDPPATLQVAGTRFSLSSGNPGSRGGQIFNYSSQGGSTFSVITTGPPGGNAVVRIGD